MSSKPLRVKRNLTEGQQLNTRDGSYVTGPPISHRANALPLVVWGHWSQTRLKKPTWCSLQEEGSPLQKKGILNVPNAEDKITQEPGEWLGTRLSSNILLKTGGEDSSRISNEQMLQL